MMTMNPTIQVRVAEITRQTPDVRTLRLVRVDGAPLGPYTAGAHVDVVGPTGVLRQYSLCGVPDEISSLLIAVKKEPASRGGSAALHDVEVGDVLAIGEPRNLLTLAEDADRHLLVAGGIGITPLLSMAHELHARAAEFELHYFARSREQAAFVDLLECEAKFRDRVHLHFGKPIDERARVLDELRAELTEASHVYTCGPEPFMDHVRSIFEPELGSAHIHIEHFVAPEIDTFADRPFTVELDTGEVFNVPVGRSILAVLEDNGIEVFKSCTEGICGSCVSGVLEGIPEHRDQCLPAATKAANTEIALCVSRALSEKLVIELY
jgi:vanillate O-demethylase ferredoxin subunit